MLNGEIPNKDGVAEASHVYSDVGVTYEVPVIDAMDVEDRVKAPPASAFSVSECSSQDELSKMCFKASSSFTPEPPSIVVFPSSSSSTSSASSVGSNKNQSTALGLSNTDLSDAKSDVNGTNASVVSHETGCLTEPNSHNVAVTNGKDHCSSEKSPKKNNKYSPRKQIQNSSDTSGAKPTELYSYMPDGERIPISFTLASRQGRAKQRWARCPTTNRLIRLVTGCVPITNDGRILFISSARKKEWILPKGGWESDERMEESAVRETYEEAGILGTLGPKLGEITFETRKGRKRRLEKLQQDKRLRQELDMKQGSDRRPSETFGSNSSCGASSEEEHNNIPPQFTSHSEELLKLSPDVRKPTDEKKSDKTDIKIPDLNQSSSVLGVVSTIITKDKPNAEKAVTTEAQLSVSYETTTISKPSHGMCRMTLFPLYVSDVLDKWPEDGRARKVYSIDEAIEVVKRDELKAVLSEVKRRGLHLVSGFGVVNKDSAKSELRS